MASRAACSNLVDLLDRRTAEDPERPTYTFLADAEEHAVSLTNGALQRAARGIAAVLQEMHAPGERALLLHPPGLDYVAAFFGCLYAGVIAVPAYPPDPLRLGRTLPRLQAIVKDAGASVALTTSGILSLAESMFELAPDLRALRWLATDDIEPAAAARWREPLLRHDALAFLQYTSGSTGLPRGVMVSHANLLDNLEQLRDVLQVTPVDVGVSWLPPYHDMGLIAMILEPLYGRGRAILMSPLSFLERPVRWLRAISRYRGSICGAPNFAYDLCVKRISAEERQHLDLASWRSAPCGAEPVRAETLQRFTQTFAACGFRREAFFPCYGLAEATLIASGGAIAAPPVVRTVQRSALARHQVVDAAHGDEDACILVGSGKRLPGHRLIIVDVEALVECPADQVGEIWISGPSVAHGYWNRPEETKHTFAAYLADTGDGPFLRTGDFGFVHDGELFITGRLKDLIILRGANHYAEDIELTVQGCNALLRRGCGAAFSVDVSGEERLVLVQEVTPRQDADWNAVIGDIRQAVAENHQVAMHTVVLVPPGSVQKTSSGKIQRHACRQEVLCGRLDVVAEWHAGGLRPAPAAPRQSNSSSAS